MVVPNDLHYTSRQLKNSCNTHQIFMVANYSIGFREYFKAAITCIFPYGVFVCVSLCCVWADGIRVEHQGSH